MEISKQCNVIKLERTYNEELKVIHVLDRGGGGGASGASGRVMAFCLSGPGTYPGMDLAWLYSV